MDTPLAMNDQELYSFWTEQLGVKFPPGTDHALAARVLRAIEQVPQPVWEKLEWVARLFEATPDEVDELATHLESQLGTVGAEAVWEQTQQGLAWLAQQCTTFDELRMPHLWVTHLLLCALSPDLMGRIQHPTQFSRTDMINEWLQHGQSLPAYCVLEVRRHLLESPPLADRADLDPSRGWIWNSLGRSLQMLGRSEEALNAYGQATALYQGPLANRSDLDSSRAWVWSSLGYSLQMLGRLEEALNAYDQAFALYQRPLANRSDLDSSRAWIWNNLGYSLQMLGRLEEALNAYDQAFALYQGPLADRPEFDPDRARTQKNRGTALYNIGQLEEALMAYDQALALYQGPLAGRAELEPDRAWTWMNRGTALRQFGRLEEAIAAYDQALDLYQGPLAGRPELDPDRAKTWMNRGTALFDLGRLEEALNAYDQAFALYQGPLADHPELDPDRAGTWINRGAALSDLGQHEAALAAYDRALALYQGPLAGCTDLDPERAKTWMNRGAVLAHLGRLEEALNAYDQALALYQGPLANRAELDPDRALTWMNRGAALGQLGQLEAALAASDRALALYQGPLAGCTDLDPERAKTLGNRGNALWQLGQLETSLAAYDQAFALYQGPLADCPELDPDRARTWMNRGLALITFGRLEEALTAYDQALALYQGPLAGRPEFDPNRARIWGDRGTIHLGLRQLKAALAAFDRALALYQGPLAGRSEHARSRFSLWAYLAQLLSLMPHPQSWAQDISYRMALSLELAPSPALDPEGAARMPLRFYQGLREEYAQFHARWLAFSLDSQDFESIPRILAALQGRKLAGQVLDELDRLEPGADTPEAVRAYRRLRLEIRQLDANIRGLVGGRGFGGEGGLRAGLSEPRPLSAERQALLEQWQQARHQAFGAYVQVRQEVARLPDYRLVDPYLTGVGVTDLTQGLAPHQALLLLLDVPLEGGGETEAIQGVLRLRRDVPPVWQPLGGLEGLVEKMETFNRALTGTRGLRRGAESEEIVPQADPTQALQDFWPAMEQAMTALFWPPLAPLLAGVTEILVIGHGRLHLLPLECGAPAGMGVRHYPGLLFYAQQQGLLGDPPAPALTEETPPLVLGFHHYAGPQADIPLTAAETRVLRRLWSTDEERAHVVEGQVLCPPGGQAPPPLHLAHVACHGDFDPRHPDQACLLLERGRYLTLRDLLTGPAQPAWMLLSACLAGRTAEDLDGDPLGLIGGFFLKGTHQLIASLCPLPDHWMPMFGALLHRALRETSTPSLDTALEAARAGIAQGHWATDEELGPLIIEAMTERLERDARLPRLEPGQPLDAPWPAIDSWLARYGLGPQARAALRQQLDAMLGCPRVQLYRRCAQAVAEHLRQQRVPPEPYLGVLRYAVRLYG